MTNISNLDEKAREITHWLSSTLVGTSAGADYEIQDGGKFVLFRAPETITTVYDKEFRTLIYKEMTNCFRGFDVQWMLVFLDSKREVIDEIDSIIGIDN
jgi:hypothetical protein